MINISFDEDAEAIYLKLSENEIVQTEELKENTVLVDLDKDGQVVGIEILNIEAAAEYLIPALSRYKIDKTRIKKDLETLRTLEPVFK